MAGFTEVALSKKLADLNSSQQSIQTLSLWLIHHRKHHATIVRVWFRELLKAKDNRKLTFMYLANDVIQNSKKKGPEFGHEFGNVLTKAFESMTVPENDEKTRRSLERILQIWEERGVYDSKLIKEFKRGLEAQMSEKGPPKKKVKAETGLGSPSERKHKPHYSHKHSSHSKVTDTEMETVDSKTDSQAKSSRVSVKDAPDPEELIQFLLDLENSASSDAAVREKIASLPREVSEVSLLSTLEDKGQAEKLCKQVNEAVQLLTEYNARLAVEMDDRRKLSVMLKEFLKAQKELLADAEQKLEEYTDKLEKIYLVRQEVKSHVQNLPDLTQLPDVTGGLAPLPSAGDLFSLH